MVIINCDMGEAFGLYKMGDDAGLMPLIDVANVACGFHGSDFNHMRKTVRLAKQHGVTKAEIEKQFFIKGRPTSLLKRFETPEEVAAVVAFVASAQGAVINGSAVRAEGGVIQSIL